MRPLQLVLLLVLVFGLVKAEPQTRYYAAHQGGEDPHLPYLLALLNAVARDQGWQYDWQPYPVPMNQARIQRSMASSESDLHLAWMMTNDEREQDMLAVPVPLFMGLIGWRIPLLAQADQELERRWQPEDWPQLFAGQMADWPDTDILQANDFSVVTTSSYVPLFHMLAARRFDYFPRSVIEVEQELETHRHLGIQMSERWLLHYPAAMYFFVSPQAPELAQELHQGLLALHDSGEFLQIFTHHYGNLIERLSLSQRQVIRLDNPLLPSSAPLDQEHLWWSLSAE